MALAVTCIRSNSLFSHLQKEKFLDTKYEMNTRESTAFLGTSKPQLQHGTETGERHAPEPQERRHTGSPHSRQAALQVSRRRTVTQGGGLVDSHPHENDGGASPRPTPYVDTNLGKRLKTKSTQSPKGTGSYLYVPGRGMNCFTKIQRVTKHHLEEVSCRSWHSPCKGTRVPVTSEVTEHWLRHASTDPPSAAGHAAWRAHRRPLSNLGRTSQTPPLYQQSSSNAPNPVVIRTTVPAASPRPHSIPGSHFLCSSVRSNSSSVQVFS